MNNLQLLILEKNENSAGVKSAKMAGPGLGILAGKGAGPKTQWDAARNQVAYMGQAGPRWAE